VSICGAASLTKRQRNGYRSLFVGNVERQQFKENKMTKDDSIFNGKIKKTPTDKWGDKNNDYGPQKPPLCNCCNLPAVRWAMPVKPGEGRGFIGVWVCAKLAKEEK